MNYFVIKYYRFIVFSFIYQIQNGQPQNAEDQFSTPCSAGILSFIPANLVRSAEMELLLATQANPLTYKNFKLSDANQIPNDGSFNDQDNTIIFVHGYLDSPNSEIAQSIVTTYKGVGGYNVLIFDTKQQESGIYLNAVKRTPNVGEQLGNAIAQMYSNGLDIDSLEVIGHSLGTHITGFAGSSFFQATGVKLPAIIALDAAGPCFASADKNSRLNEDDATFVQAIHTNSGGLGITDPVGTVDIYVNNGQQQGCGTICSHIAAVNYWLSAVQNPNNYRAQKCQSVSAALSESCNSNEVVTMGPNIDRNAKGIYHLTASINN